MENEEKIITDTRTIVGVRFRTAGKIYYFDPGELEIKRGAKVIVETSRGVEFGSVVGDPMVMENKKISQPLKQVIRLATKEDIEKEALNRIREREAFRLCQEKIRRHDLDMKLIDAEYTFDNSKILFYFTADGRVDFRDLVRDLAGASPDRRQGRDQDHGRLRHLRQAFVLPCLSVRFRARIHQDGQGTEPVPESHQDLRILRQAHVLPQVRRGYL